MTTPSKPNHAQAAALAGKRPRVGSAVDMGDVPVDLYDVDPTLPSTMWTCTPKPKPKPAPMTEVERLAASSDRVGRLSRGPANLIFALAAIGNVGRR